MDQVSVWIDWLLSGVERELAIIVMYLFPIVA